MSNLTVLAAHVVGGRRQARKRRACGAETPSCARMIEPGDVYLEQVVFPGHDVAGRAKPYRMHTCAPCAVYYRSEHVLDPIPYEQLARQGLVSLRRP